MNRVNLLDLRGLSTLLPEENSLMKTLFSLSFRVQSFFSKNSPLFVKLEL